MYDLTNPIDLFTILPQEMEIAEIKGIISNLDGPTRKALVIKVIVDIAKENSIEIDEDILSVFIDVINSASKGEYALNKKKDL